MNNYVIPPRFTLPMKPIKAFCDTHPLPSFSFEEERKKEPVREKRSYAFLFFFETIYLLAAGELGFIAYTYFAPWPIYRIVAFVALFILWSNFASSLARNKSTKEQAIELLSTMSIRAVPKKLDMSDTTAYLAAIRESKID